MWDQYGTKITKNGKVIRRSKNLRGIIDYARCSPVAKVDGVFDPDNEVRGILTVEYSDGCTSKASFASYHIMVDWVRNRRIFRDALVTLSKDFGYFTKPGVRQ